MHICIGTFSQIYLKLIHLLLSYVAPPYFIFSPITPMHMAELSPPPPAPPPGLHSKVD
jgi:hypothetical protein